MKTIKIFAIVAVLAFASVFARTPAIPAQQRLLLDTLETVREELSQTQALAGSLQTSLLEVVAQRDSMFLEMINMSNTSEVDSLRDIVEKATRFRETARVKFDSLRNENTVLLRELESQRVARERDRWLASRAVFMQRQQNLEEYNKNILANKKFYLGVWVGGGTGFADYEGSFSRKPNGGFSASWQIGKILALRSGVDWIRSEFVHDIKGYRGEIAFVEDTARTLQIPVLFEWAVRRGMISTQLYGGVYFGGNLDNSAPGMTAGLDIGVKAWNGYAFVGFQRGSGIVEYDAFNTIKIGYSFGLATKMSYKLGKTKKAEVQNARNK
ncbi:MAG: hypothetical protein FWE23_00620 [Chitinivibrionia bacterium]|nr:hypothetical protein [Chitinivibrionia bacterium]